MRLPADVVAAIDGLVPAVHATRSDAVRRAIEMYLYRLRCEQDAAIYDAVPLGEAELALANDPGAWEATPAW